MDHLNFENLLADFTRAALRLIEEYVQARGVPLFLKDPVRFNTDGSWTRELQVEPFWVEVERALRESISALSETEAVLRVMWMEGIPRRVKMRVGDEPIENPTFEQARNFYYGELVLWLRGYLERTNHVNLVVAVTMDFNFDIDQFAGSAQRMVTTWKAEEFPRVVIVPLLNFEGDFDVVSLSDHLRIVPMTVDEKSKYLDPMSTDRTAYTVRQLQGLTHKAEYSYRTDSPIESHRSPAVPTIERLLTALRLHKEGDVGALSYKDAIRDDMIGSFGAGGSLSDYWLPLERSAMKYRISEDEVGALTVIMKMLEQCEKRRGYSDLAVPLRRFNQSYSRERDDDRLLDLTVVLESSLLFGDTVELSYKIALRAAAILRNRADPTEVFAVFRDLYKARSAIVHSGKGPRELEKKLTRSLPVGEFCALVTKYIRMILCEYLQRTAAGETVKQITDGLDEEVVRQIASAPPTDASY